jgi:hypothetical protein
MSLLHAHAMILAEAWPPCGTAMWAVLDLIAGTWSKPASSTKQNQDHVVPLSAPARQLLAEITSRQKDKEFVFRVAATTMIPK